MAKTNVAPSGHVVVLLPSDVTQRDTRNNGSRIRMDEDAQAGPGRVIPVWEEANVSRWLLGVIVGERDVCGLPTSGNRRRQDGSIFAIPIFPSAAILVGLRIP